MRALVSMLCLLPMLATAAYNYLPRPGTNSASAGGSGVMTAWNGYYLWSAASTAPTFANTYSVGFDGINDYVTNNSASACTYTNALTVLFWAYWDATCPNFGVMAAKYDYGNGNRCWLLRYNTAGPTIEAIVSGAGTSISKSYATTTGATGGWHHVGLSFTNNDLRMYVDGVVPATTTNTENSIVNLHAASTVPMSFGHNFNNGTPAFPFKGNIDEVKIWNRALSAAEVATVYNSGVPDGSGSPDNWWRMGDGDAYPTLLDGIGGKSATMVNQSATNIVTEVP